MKTDHVFFFNYRVKVIQYNLHLQTPRNGGEKRRCICKNMEGDRGAKAQRRAGYCVSLE